MDKTSAAIVSLRPVIVAIGQDRDGSKLVVTSNRAYHHRRARKGSDRCLRAALTRLHRRQPYTGPPYEAVHAMLLR